MFGSRSCGRRGPEDPRARVTTPTGRAKSAFRLVTDLPAITFRGIAFVAPTLHARAGRRLSRAHRTMSEPELTEMLRILRRTPDAVAEWSEGNAAFDEFEIRVLEEPITHLTAVRPGVYWVAAEDIAGVIDRYVPRGRWDSVFLVYPTDGSFPQCGWACSVGPTPAANGAGFSSITSDRWEPDMHRLFPEEGFVHEWLHQVEGMYRELGLTERSLPTLHDVADRTSARARSFAPYGRGYVEYERETGTWQPWYRDLMTGTVGRKGREREPLGLTPERWALRRGREARA